MRILLQFPLLTATLKVFQTHLQKCIALRRRKSAPDAAKKRPTALNARSVASDFDSHLVDLIPYGLDTRTRSDLNSIGRSNQRIDRSMRSLQKSLRDMNTSINRARVPNRRY